MNHSDLLAALLDYVAATLVDDCDRPTPHKVLRYHGLDGLPEDCCVDAGVLSAGWERIDPTARFPESSANRGDAPCPGYPMTSIAIRYVICWPILASPPEVTNEEYTRWDTDAAVLADVAECVTRALIRLTCANTNDELFQAVLAETPCNAFRFREAIPTGPSGGCAGILWRAYAGLRATPGVS